MNAAPPPGNESERLAQLQSYEVLDSIPEVEYDDLAYIASQICGTSIALISFVDKDRQWFKARVGLEAVETSRDLAFCAHAILNPQELFVVENTLHDERFHDNPLVQGGAEIRFYAGAPLVTASGDALGTLCVIDEKPRELTPEQGFALKALSRQAMALLELRRMILAFEKGLAERQVYERRLEEYQMRLEEMNASLMQQSGTDMLTGAANRRTFDARLAEEIDRANRHQAHCSLVMLDVDHFKAFNDTFGHQAGDAVLRSVAEFLQTTCRSGDTLARYGGEEFAVILPNTLEEGAFILAERFRRAIENGKWPQRPVTISVGVTTYTGGASTPAEIIERADQALYQAKATGRNRVVDAGRLLPKAV